MRRPLLTLTLLLCPFLAAIYPVGAEVPPIGDPELVADLEQIPTQEDSSITGMVGVGPIAYFATDEPDRGRTLWRSDGTATGTRPVVELNSAGGGHTFLREVKPVGDKLYFTTSAVTSGAYLEDLWVTGGSGGATRIARYLPRLPDAAELPGFGGLTAFGDRLLFAGLDREHGREVWISDGTAAGTRRIADLCPGTCSSNPAQFVILGERAYFAARAPERFEDVLWSTDGTPEGSRRAAEGLSLVYGGDLFVHRDRVYFLGREGREDALGLVMLERREESPRLLAKVQPDDPAALGPHFSRFVAVGDTVYLMIETVLQPPPGQARVWRTDGTPEGTRPATEILSAGRSLIPGRTAVLGSTLLFTAWNGRVTDGPGPLWILEPGASEARPLFDGSDGSLGPQVSTWGGPLGAVLGDRLVLRTAGPTRELWVTDGTQDGTRPIEPRGGERLVLSYPMVSLGDEVLFAADDGMHGEELWTTDGTTDGTHLVMDIALPRASSNPRAPAAAGGRLLFLADEHGGEPALWRTANRSRGVDLVRAEAPYDALLPAGDRLFLPDGPGGTFGFEAAVFLEPGATSVTPLPVAGTLYSPETMPDGRLFFAQRDELWVSDGTAAGTKQLYDAGPGDGYRGPLIRGGPPPVPYGLTSAGGRLFFVGFGDHEYQLWTTDGTAEGTSLAADFVGAPTGGVALNGGLLFEGDQYLSAGGEANAVWWSDGTPAGTRKLAQIDPLRIVAADGVAFLITVSPEGGFGIWRTDGTPAGTLEVTRVGSAGIHGPLLEVAAAGDRLYFALHTLELGEELWVSDGTAAGTHPVRDLRPGPEGSHPSDLTAVGDLLAFAADDGEAGREPWLTDGSLAGTTRIADLHPGPPSSNPGAFARVDDSLYFAADDGEVGRELWQVRLGEPEGQPPPVPPEATEIEVEELAGFRLWVLITRGGTVFPTRQEAACLPETVCVSGAVPGRSELFVRLVGPKANGFLWPTLVRFSTSTIDVWLEQFATGARRHYRLDGVGPDDSDLPGHFDRRGFLP